MRLLPLLLLTGLIIISFGCNTTKKMPLKLTGEKWQLKSYTDAKGNQLMHTGETGFFTLETETTLAGHSGCNTFGGEYTLKGDQLQADVFSTKRYCKESANQEKTIFAVLAAGATVKRTGDLMTLTAGRQVLTYEPYFEKPVTGDPIGMVSPEEYQSREEAGTPVKRYTGMMTYYADAGVFTDCADGKTYSVATGEGAWLACEKAMLRMNKKGSDPALVVVDGTMIKNPEPEGREYLLKITRFITGSADGGCP